MNARYAIRLVTVAGILMTVKWNSHRTKNVLIAKARTLMTWMMTARFAMGKAGSPNKSAKEPEANKNSVKIVRAWGIYSTSTK